MGADPRQQHSLQEKLLQLACFAVFFCFSVQLLLGTRKNGSLETTLQCFSTNMDMADPIKCPEWVLTLDNSTHCKKSCFVIAGTEPG